MRRSSVTTVGGNVDAWEINFGSVVSDSFTLSGGGTSVKGGNFSVWTFPGDTISQVDWSITSDPNSGTVYGSGTAPVSCTFQFTNIFGSDGPSSAYQYALGPLTTGKGACEFTYCSETFQILGDSNIQTQGVPEPMTLFCSAWDSQGWQRSNDAASKRRKPGALGQLPPKRCVQNPGEPESSRSDERCGGTEREEPVAPLVGRRAS